MIVSCGWASSAGLVVERVSISLRFRELRLNVASSGAGVAYERTSFPTGIVWRGGAASI